MLIDTVRRTISDHQLLSAGDHVVLGVSGGPDSVCLLHVLQRLARDLQLTIHPVHVNHMFRPGEAERDQAYVEALCAKAGLSCRTFLRDCPALAKTLGISGEEVGRKVRYEAFYQVATEVAAEMQRCDPDSAAACSVKIAVAHNANDQAETILHRILRGTGTDGLTGIAYQRYEKDVLVIRPLLDVKRSEIEQYCADNGLQPRLDHTNLEPVYTRNKLRLELLPQLEAYNPNVVDTLVRLGRIAASDSAALWQEAERVFRQLQISEEAVQETPVTSPGSARNNRKISPHALQRNAGAARGPATSTPQAACLVLDRAGLAACPAAIRHRVILRGFTEIGLSTDISEERLRAADAIIGKKQAPKTVQFPRGYQLTVKQGRVLLSRK